VSGSSIDAMSVERERKRERKREREFVWGPGRLKVNENAVSETNEGNSYLYNVRS